MVTCADDLSESFRSVFYTGLILTKSLLLLSPIYEKNQVIGKKDLNEVEVLSRRSICCGLGATQFIFLDPYSLGPKEFTI